MVVAAASSQRGPVAPVLPGNPGTPTYQTNVLRTSFIMYSSS